MNDLRKYQRREKTLVAAVQLDLETEGFTYQKWGGTQIARPGDWLVSSNGNVYTVDCLVFEKTYEFESLGVYRKVGAVWAKQTKKKGESQRYLG